MIIDDISRSEGPLEHETIDQYLTELKLIAKNCSFGELENQLIRDRIVCGTNSEEVRQRLLRVEVLSLDKAISICRAEEESKKSAQYLTEGYSAEVCDLKKKARQPHTSPTNKQEDSRKYSGETPHPSAKYLYNNCGSQHPRKQCPAYGKRCRQCGKLNHFAKHCRSRRRKVEAVERDKESSSPNALFAGAIENANKTEFTTDECHTTLQVEGHSAKFKVDTGSQVNILPLNVYRKLNTKSSLTKPRQSLQVTVEKP